MTSHQTESANNKHPTPSDVLLFNKPRQFGQLWVLGTRSISQCDPSAASREAKRPMPTKYAFKTDSPPPLYLNSLHWSHFQVIKKLCSWTRAFLPRIVWWLKLLWKRRGSQTTLRLVQIIQIFLLQWETLNRDPAEEDVRLRRAHPKLECLL